MDLLLFQIGPVQDFIAQAATPEDLWAGSYLLSMLMKAGLEAAPDATIFPNLRDGRVEKALDGNIPTLPNRFWARVPEGQGRTIAEKVKEAILKKLYAYGEGESVAFQRQLEQFLSVSWAVRPETADKGSDYKSIARQLALRRNMRDFQPWREAKGFERAPKDFLSGKESALENCRGAMNLVKEKLIEERKYEAPIRNAVNDDPYYAVIAFDGDRMGAKLSTLQTEEAHREFSGKLAAFALSVGDLLSEKTNGQSTLVYAGGDDVLAVVPGKKALDCAEALREQFEGIVGLGMTASAGVAVGHCKAPLQDLVKAAQSAEHRAKNVYGRDAVAMTVLKRSGETIEWGFKWKKDRDSQPTAAVELFRKLGADIASKKPSARFPYKLAALLRPYALEKAGVEDMKPSVRLELEHAWKQSVETDMESGRKVDLPKEALSYLDETFDAGKPDDFLNLFLCETFIDRPRGEEN